MVCNAISVSLFEWMDFSFGSLVGVRVIEYYLQTFDITFPCSEISGISSMLPRRVAEPATDEAEERNKSGIMIQSRIVLDYSHYSHHIGIRNPFQVIELLEVSSKRSLLKALQVSVL